MEKKWLIVILVVVLGVGGYFTLDKEVGLSPGTIGLDKGEPLSGILSNVNKDSKMSYKKGFSVPNYFDEAAFYSELHFPSQASAPVEGPPSPGGSTAPALCVPCSKIRIKCDNSLQGGKMKTEVEGTSGVCKIRMNEAFVQGFAGIGIGNGDCDQLFNDGDAFNNQIENWVNNPPSVDAPVCALWHELQHYKQNRCFPIPILQCTREGDAYKNQLECLNNIAENHCQPVIGENNPGTSCGAIGVLKEGVKKMVDFNGCMCSGSGDLASDCETCIDKHIDGIYKNEVCKTYCREGYLDGGSDPIPLCDEKYPVRKR